MLVQLGSIVGTLLAASFLVYLLTVLAPGDPALALFRARYGDSAPAASAQLEAIRREAGFDRSLIEQYAQWLGRVAQGDFGVSFTRRRPVAPLIVERLPITLGLTLGSLTLALALALPAGLLFSQSRVATQVGLAVTQVGVSTPEYFLAVGLMLIFAVKLGLTPVAGIATPVGFALPLATLAFRPWSTFTRLVMSGVDETRRSDFVRTGRAKGLAERYLLTRHILPHALLPIVPLVGAAASGALAAGVVAEVIFAIPGVGRLLYEAIGERDVPMAQACLLIQVSLAILANGLADMALRWLNPALRRPVSG